MADPNLYLNLDQYNRGRYAAMDDIAEHGILWAEQTAAGMPPLLEDRDDYELGYFAAIFFYRNGAEL
jgi:hypothetical protein